MDSFTFISIGERLYLEPLLKPDRLFHGGRARRFWEFDLMPVILIKEMEELWFIPGTHREIFVHLGVLVPDLLSLLLWEVGDLARVDANGPLDRCFIFVFLNKMMGTCSSSSKRASCSSGSTPVSDSRFYLRGGRPRLFLFTIGCFFCGAAIVVIKLLRLAFQNAHFPRPTHHSCISPHPPFFAIIYPLPTRKNLSSPFLLYSIQWFLPKGLWKFIKEIKILTLRVKTEEMHTN